MTLEQAKMLQVGDVIHCEVFHADKVATCQRWRVTGKVKTWKKDLGRVRVPLKHGLYHYGYLTEGELEWNHLEDDCKRR